MMSDDRTMRIAAAELRVQDAQRRVHDASEDLDDARMEACAALEDLRRELERE